MTPDFPYTFTVFHDKKLGGGLLGSGGSNSDKNDDNNNGGSAPTTDKNFTALAYKSTTTGTGCNVSAFNNVTTGSIAFVDPTTICCP